MKTSPAGRAAITQREGNVLKAYKDSVGIWTIGVGHTAAAGGPAPKAGMKITAAESDEILSRDLVKFEKAVDDAVTVPLTQNQFDALVSLAFNIGGGAFAKSTLVKKLNKRDYGGAADAFMSWNKAGGKTLKGLTTRRKAERAQFLKGKRATGKPAGPLQNVEAPSPIVTPEIVQVAAPVAATIDKQLIANAQKRLIELHYNPGGADGIIGPLTKGAIMAFRNDNGLIVKEEIDDEFLLKLQSAKPREMIAARANATPAQVASMVPEAKVHWWNRIGAAAVGGTAAVGGAVDYIAPATGYLAPVKEFIGEVPAVVWIAGIVAVAALLYFASQYGANKATQAYRDGDRR